MLSPAVFKAYDVRGLYPDELDEEGAYAIGRAYVEQFEPKRIAVGRDMRLSSPSMAAALIDGAVDGGADVLDLGMVGTEMVYFAVGELGLDGGVCVTASHNPKQYTGMKIVRAGALPVGGESGLLDVRDRALKPFGPPAKRGSGGGERTSGTEFVDKVLSFVDVSAIEPLTVVIDAANGMAGAMLPPVLERLPIDAVTCYFEPDGSFPNHEPNPLLPENREFIVAQDARGAGRPRRRVRRGRRPLLLRRRHGRVRPRRLRHRAPRRVDPAEGARRQVSSTTCARAAPCRRRSSGPAALPLINRVGHAYIKHRMRKEDAVFGGEVSAHYYFRDFSQADSGVVPFLLLRRADLEERAQAVGAPRARTASGSSSPARSTRPSPTWRRSCRS